MRSLDLIGVLLELSASLIMRLLRPSPRNQKELDLNDLVQYGSKVDLFVTEVTREFYYVDMEKGSVLGLVACPCFCVYLAEPVSTNWSFIRRIASKVGEFPNGYTLVLEDGSISDEVWEILAAIAREAELNRINLEIEHFGDKVCAYTMSILGEAVVDQIHTILIQLRDESK